MTVDEEIKKIFVEPTLIGAGTKARNELDALAANGWSEFDVSNAARALVEATRIEARGAGYRGAVYAPMSDDEWSKSRGMGIVNQAYADARTVLKAVKREMPKQENDK